MLRGTFYYALFIRLTTLYYSQKYVNLIELSLLLVTFLLPSIENVTCNVAGID